MARTKGTSIVEIVKLLRTRSDEARAILPAPLHHYLEDRVLEGQWYPEADLAGLLRALVELLGRPEEEILPFLGAEAMRRNREGAYAHLFARCSPPRIPRLAGIIWSAMHDTGALRIDEVEPGRWCCELVDYGHPSGEMCGILEGYGRALLELAGHRNVRVHKDACVLGGDARCTWTFRTDPS